MVYSKNKSRIVSQVRSGITKFGGMHETGSDI